MNKFLKVFLVGLILTTSSCTTHADTIRSFKIYNNTPTPNPYECTFNLLFKKNPNDFIPANAMWIISSQNVKEFGDTVDFIHYNIPMSCDLACPNPPHNHGISTMNIMFNINTGDVNVSGTCNTDSNHQGEEWMLMYAAGTVTPHKIN